MALADYYLCDVCNRKTFYDAVLDYQRNDDGSLQQVGAMACICPKCAETHDVKIISKLAGAGRDGDVLDALCIKLAEMSQAEQSGDPWDAGYHCAIEEVRDTIAFATK